MSNEKAYYDLVWSQVEIAPRSDDMYKTIKSMLPKNIRTIVDVGCGNGSVTNHFANDYQVAGVDYSAKALSKLSPSITTICANAVSIPLNDECADLLMSTELLEHLNDDDFPKVISEMIRLSKKYILVSVPNDEQLRERYTRCSNCDKVFHIYLHKRSFNKDTVGSLFKGWHVTDIKYCGVSDYYKYDWLATLQNKVAHSYLYPTTVKMSCPYCGHVIVPMKAHIVRRIIGRGFYIVEKIIAIGKRPKLDWMVVLFEKAS